MYLIRGIERKGVFMKKCSHCKKKVPDNSHFCLYCGKVLSKQGEIVSNQLDITELFTPTKSMVVQNTSSAIIAKSLPQKKAKIRLLFLFFLTAGLLLLWLFVLKPVEESSTTMNQEQATENWKIQFQSSQKAMEDGNYHEASTGFLLALEHDPQQAETYLALSELYLIFGDIDSALAILAQGETETGDSSIIAYHSVLKVQAQSMVNLQQEIENLLLAEMCNLKIQNQEIRAFLERSDVEVFSYDINNDGTMDWILKAYSNHEEMYEYLLCTQENSYFSIDYKELGQSGANSGSGIFWSPSLECIVIQYTKNSSTTVSNQLYHYGTFENLAAYVKPTGGESFFTVEGLLTTVEEYEEFVSDLSLQELHSSQLLRNSENFRTILNTSLGENYLPMNLEFTLFPSLVSTLLQGELLLQGEVMDLDGDGVADYLLHSPDSKASLLLNNPDTPELYANWQPKTLVIMSNYATPYCYVTSTSEIEYLRDNYYVNLDHSDLPVTPLEDGTYEIFLQDELYDGTPFQYPLFSTEEGEKITSKIATPITFTTEEIALWEVGDTIRAGNHDRSIVAPLQLEFSGDYGFCHYFTDYDEILVSSDGENWQITSSSPMSRAFYSSPTTFLIPWGTPIYVNVDSSIAGSTIAELLARPEELYFTRANIVVEHGSVVEVELLWQS